MVSYPMRILKENNSNGYFVKIQGCRNAGKYASVTAHCILHTAHILYN
jgi:hypothetical protein